MELRTCTSKYKIRYFVPMFIACKYFVIVPITVCVYLSLYVFYLCICLFLSLFFIFFVYPSIYQYLHMRSYPCVHALRHMCACAEDQTQRVMYTAERIQAYTGMFRCVRVNAHTLRRTHSMHGRVHTIV